MPLHIQETTNHEPQTTDNASALAVVEPSAQDWDALTQRHSLGHMLQSSGWGVLKQQVGWAVRRLLVVGADGPRGGAQVLFRRRMGLSAAYVPRGPLFAEDTASNTLLLAALDRLARRAHAVFLRIEPNVLESDERAGRLHSTLLVHGFRASPPLQPRTTLHLDLAPEPERLLAAMSKGHRADIRRAAREGVGVRVGSAQADLDAFYTIMEQTGKRAEFGIHNNEYYRAAWEQFRATPHGDCARLLLAERDSATLAAFLIFAWASAAAGCTTSGVCPTSLATPPQPSILPSAPAWRKRRSAIHYMASFASRKVSAAKWFAFSPHTTVCICRRSTHSGAVALVVKLCPKNKNCRWRRPAGWWRGCARNWSISAS